jgi:NAD(P)-dependent dehydrogenase (short-subunit alcohol dehydrogenase family)
VTVHAGRFRDRAAVITGGASGIGLHTAKRLLAEGGAVALWDVDAQALRSAREALGPRCHPLEVDVAQWPSVEAGVQRSVAAMNKIDILIAGAGITGPNAALADYSLSDWQRVIDINLTGVFHACRAVVPRMLDNNYGRIVNISSIAGKEGNPNAAAYSASKAGIIALTKSLGKELAKTNVLVDAVAPAVFKSPLLSQMTEQHVEYMLSKIPMGRFGEPDEITAMICWLASDEMSFSTGAIFDASGGRATY